MNSTKTQSLLSFHSSRSEAVTRGVIQSRYAIAVVVGLMATGTTRAAAGPVVDLGTLGGTSSHVAAINNAGQAVGYSYVSGDATYHGFLYRGGVMTDLGTFGGSSSVAWDINDAGQIVVSTSTGSVFHHAFLYDNGVTTDLGTLGGTSSSPAAINDVGQITGTSDTTGDAEQHAFIYANGVMNDLGTLGGTYSRGVQINSAGQVAGNSSLAGNAVGHAFLYSDGSMIDLGTLGGAGSEASAINDAGQVVGWSDTATGDTHAFLYDHGVMTDLGTIGGPHSRAYAINDSGQVVGSTGTVFFPHAFLYGNGVMTDLGTLGGSSSQAVSINDAGQVAGTASGIASTEGDAGTSTFLYADGVMTAVRTLDGADYDAGPSAMNESGQIAGHAVFLLPTTYAYHAYVSPCPARPATTCSAGRKATLRIRDESPATRRLVWRWADGAGVDQQDLGDPSTNTSLRLCIYDSTAGVSTLVGHVEIDPNEHWLDANPDGWAYKDSTGIEDGVHKLQLGSGAIGRASMRLDARGPNLPMPAAFSAGEFFDQDSGVTVQMFNDATSKCWSSVFSVATTNTATRFRATTP